MAFDALVQRGSAQGDALVNRAAIADFGRFADDHAHGMVKEHALADLGAGMNFNPREKAGDMGNKPPGPLESVRPAPVRQTVQDHCMQTGIAGQHLPGAARSRVAVKNALDIGA